MSETRGELAIALSGLPRPPLGVASMLATKHQAPAYDAGFVASVKAGRIEIVAAVEGFDGADVLLADGARVQPDAVIAATGYRRGLEPLVGHLGVLDERGTPLVSGGRQHPSAPGSSSPASAPSSPVSCA
jgi:putative flavoprotein involved in K+ transport